MALTTVLAMHSEFQTWPCVGPRAVGPPRRCCVPQPSVQRQELAGCGSVVKGTAAGETCTRLGLNAVSSRPYNSVPVLTCLWNWGPWAVSSTSLFSPAVREAARLCCNLITFAPCFVPQCREPVHEHILA